MRVIKKILIANRGEIAVRIQRTVNELGISTVAVFSDADKDSLFVQLADEAIGLRGNTAAETYLNQDKIIAAAKETGADAVHPGYGFLSENHNFAKRCEDEGLIFIGPSADIIQKLGSKSSAKEIAIGAGVPVVPGYNGEDQTLGRFQYEISEIGYPVLLKASAGGGGRGMRIVNDAEELESAFNAAKREAEKSFGDSTLLVEKFFHKAKHIEFQILGDQHGRQVQLGERECSMQRKYQKLIEETPSPSITQELREQMAQAALSIASAVQYTSAGTVEFLLDEEKNFYFLEVNTRLQVEHPVTEVATMLDLVHLQILIAEGKQLPEYVQNVETPMIYSIECRVCAENPTNNFQPATGKILAWNPADSSNLRVDSGIDVGSIVSPFYDSMLAKLIVMAGSRELAISSMLRVLEDTALLGVDTNIDFLKTLISHDSFVDGSFDTKLIERELSDYQRNYSQTDLHLCALAAWLQNWFTTNERASFDTSLNGWRNIFYQPFQVSFKFLDREMTVEYRHLGEGFFSARIENDAYEIELLQIVSNSVIFLANGNRHSLFVIRNENDFHIHFFPAGVFKLTLLPRFQSVESQQEKGSYTAPMPGEVVSVLVKVGDKVEAGKPMLIMNSMKMETTIEAHTAGVVEEIFVTDKSFVEAGALLIKMKEE